MLKQMSAHIDNLASRWKISRRQVILLVSGLCLVLVACVLYLVIELTSFYSFPLRTITQGPNRYSIQNHAFGDQISFQSPNGNLILSVFNELTVFSVGQMELLVDEDPEFLELNFVDGYGYVFVNKPTLIKFGEQEFLLTGEMELIVSAKAKSIYVVRGEGEWEGKPIQKNKQIAINNKGKYVLSNTNRKLFAGNGPLGKLVSQLAENGLLPNELSDLTGPELVEFTPKQNKSTQAKKITVTGKVSPDTVKIIYQGQSVQFDEEFNFTKSINLSVGAKNYKFTLEDEFGNETSFNYKITRVDPCAGNTTCGECGNPACRVPNSSSANNCDATFASQMLSLINNHRRNNGRGNLTLDGLMSNAACGHSIWMNNTGTLSHTGAGGSTYTQRCAAAGTSCAAENIAFHGAASAQNIFDLWKNSSGHNANMLGNFTKIGIGKSEIYATTVFK